MRRLQSQRSTNSIFPLPAPSPTKSSLNRGLVQPLMPSPANLSERCFPNNEAETLLVSAHLTPTRTFSDPTCMYFDRIVKQQAWQGALQGIGAIATMMNNVKSARCHDLPRYTIHNTRRLPVSIVFISIPMVVLPVTLVLLSIVREAVAVITISSAPSPGWILRRATK